MSLATRVLVLAPAIDGADGVGEVSRQAANGLAEAWDPESIEVWTFGGGRSSKLNPRIRFRSAGESRGRLALWAALHARARLDDLLVLTMHAHLSPIGLMLAMRGARSAVFLHGIEAWRRLRLRERVALRRADTLLANSNWTAMRFKQANAAFQRTDVRVCPLGVDFRSQTSGPTEDAGYALIVGRLAASERYKGHDALLDIWPSVLAVDPSARLIIAGDGDDRSRLESVAALRQLTNAVRFVGRVPDDALAALYRDAAFFVLPSTGEGFGLAYLEAMRAGKACIAAPGAADEIVVHNVTGLVVEPSGAPLADAVRRLFADPGLCASMGRAGAARAASRFQASHFQSRLVLALAPFPGPAELAVPEAV